MPAAVDACESKPLSVVPPTIGKIHTCAAIRIAPTSARCVRAELVDAQVGELVQSFKLPANWEDDRSPVMPASSARGPDPEAERKDIRTMLRLMRENYERGLYEGEEYQYWQKVML